MQEEFSIEYVYDALRKERINANLQVVERDFFVNVSRFIKEQEDAIRKTQDIKEASKQEKQLESIKKVIRELYEKREAKIIQLALSDIKTNSNLNTSFLLNEEKEFYNIICENIKYFRNSVIENINKGIIPELKPREQQKQEDIKLKTIRFLESLPKFIGTDLNVYGPFEKEYISNLPLEIANYLIKHNKAEGV